MREVSLSLSLSTYRPFLPFLQYGKAENIKNGTLRDTNTMRSSRCPNPVVGARRPLPICTDLLRLLRKLPAKLPTGAKLSVLLSSVMWLALDPLRIL